MGGVIKYEQTKRYDFESQFKGPKNDRIKDFLATLPKESKAAKILQFNATSALFGDDPEVQEALPENLQKALRRASYFSPPNPEVTQVYYDFENDKKLEQVDFMTRTFRINSEITPPSWKLNTRKIKVLDYVCMGAETQIGEQTITAWFSPQIPVSAGPDRFFGLPGVILALEIDGEMAFLATEIILNTETATKIEKPSDGKKIKQEAFDLIVAEKEEEFHKEMEARRKSRGHGRGHGKRGH